MAGHQSHTRPSDQFPGDQGQSQGDGAPTDPHPRAIPSAASDLPDMSHAPSNPRSRKSEPFVFNQSAPLPELPKDQLIDTISLQSSFSAETARQAFRCYCSVCRLDASVAARTLVGLTLYPTFDEGVSAC